MFQKKLRKLILQCQFQKTVTSQLYNDLQKELVAKTTQLVKAKSLSFIVPSRWPGKDCICPDKYLLWKLKFLWDLSIQTIKRPGKVIWFDTNSAMQAITNCVTSKFLDTLLIFPLWLASDYSTANISALALSWGPMNEISKCKVKDSLTFNNLRHIFLVNPEKVFLFNGKTANC